MRSSAPEPWVLAVLLVGVILGVVGVALARPEYVPDPCRDVCEVLDMMRVGETPCECICYDPAVKRVERFVHPRCTGE